MATLSSTTSWLDGDPLTPAVLNAKRDVLIANIEAVNNQVGSGWFNVTDPQFGAAGDGSTDDTLSILSAINTCAGTGGTVFFPIGTYRITSTLTVTSPMQFLGSGRSTVITFGLGMNRVGILTQGATSFDTLAWFSLKDLSINGNASGPNDAGLAQINNVDRLVMTGCHLFNSGSTSSSNGVAVAAASSSATAIPTRGVIAFNLIEGHSKAGINWSTNASDGIIFGNIVRNNSGTGFTPGIQVNGGHEVMVMGNSVYSNEGRGIYVATVGTVPPIPSRHVTVVGNTVYGNGLSSATEGAGIAILNGSPSVRYGRTIVANNNVHRNGRGGVDAGIMVQNQDNVLLNGNVSEFNGNHGIFVDACRHVTIHGNQALSNNTGGNSGVGGITLRNVSDSIVMGNISTDSQTTQTQEYGLTFFSGGTCERVQVLGNHFAGNKLGGILRNGGLTDCMEQGNLESSAAGSAGGRLTSVRTQASLASSGNVRDTEWTVTIGTSAATLAIRSGNTTFLWTSSATTTV